MKYFCEQAIELPTLKSLASANLNYVSRPDVVKICAEQASTISDTIVKESTVGSSLGHQHRAAGPARARVPREVQRPTPSAAIASGVTKALG